MLATDNGTDGLKLARMNLPDLILLDLMMPIMDGVAVCQQLKADLRLKNIPVVLLSSSDDSDEIEACLQLGAVGYLLKPFQPAVLVDMVRKHLPA